MVKAKKDKESQNKPVKITQERKLERELLWVVGFCIFLVGLFFVASAIFKSFNEFDYEGLHFTVERFDKLIVYHYYYYFKDAQGKLNKYNLYLRYDPRKNDVPVEGGTVRFRGGSTYISLDTSTDLIGCSQSSLAVGDLAVFLSNNKIATTQGNMNKTEAILLNQTYVTCENNPEDSVIQIFRGNETKMIVNGRCITLEIGPSCDVLQAVEKLKLRAVLGAKQTY